MPGSPAGDRGAPRSRPLDVRGAPSGLPHLRSAPGLREPRCWGEVTSGSPLSARPLGAPEVASLLPRAAPTGPRVPGAASPDGEGREGKEGEGGDTRGQGDKGGGVSPVRR